MAAEGFATCAADDYGAPVVGNKVLLQFLGYIDQEYLEKFVRQVEKDEAVGPAGLRHRVANVMIELGQNLIAHGAPHDRPALEVGRDRRGIYVRTEGSAQEEKARSARERIERFKDMAEDELRTLISAHPGLRGAGLMEVVSQAALDSSRRPLVAVETTPAADEGLRKVSIRAYVR